MLIPGNSLISFAFLSFAAGFACRLFSSLTPPMRSVIFAVKQKKCSNICKQNTKPCVNKHFFDYIEEFLCILALYKSENKVTVSWGGKTYLSRRRHCTRTRAAFHVIMLISSRAGNFTSGWRPPRRLQCLLKVPIGWSRAQKNEQWNNAPNATRQCSCRLSVSREKKSFWGVQVYLCEWDFNSLSSNRPLKPCAGNQRSETHPFFVINFIGMISWTKKSVSRWNILSSAQVGMLQKLLENSWKRDWWWQQMRKWKKPTNLNEVNVAK